MTKNPSEGISITIPFKTPTINHLHGRNFRGSVYLKPEAKKLKKEIIEICSNGCFLDKELFKNIKENRLKVTVEVHEDWLCKDGSVKRKDIANREKFLIDAVFDGLGLDDKFIFEHSMKKIQDTKEYSVVKIEVENGD